TEAKADKATQAIQALSSIAIKATADNAKQAIEVLKSVAMTDSSDKANQAIETLKDIVLTYSHSGPAIEALESVAMTDSSDSASQAIEALKSILLAFPVDEQRITLVQVNRVLNDIQKVDLPDEMNDELNIGRAQSIPLSDHDKAVLQHVIQSNTLLTDDQIRSYSTSLIPSYHGPAIVSPSLQQLCCWLDKCVTKSQSLDQSPSSGIVRTRTVCDLSSSPSSASSRSSTVSWLTIRLTLLQFLYQNRDLEVTV
ncbi:hypothetical protein EBZ35_07785, partial [bacterium]|nr:hypothetical protein [bacterium]